MTASSPFKGKNTYRVVFSLLSILGYGIFVFAAGPFAPGATLDPVADFPSDCSGPADTDCFVTPGWSQNTTDNYVYNTTDMIGIGTNTPTSTLTVNGTFASVQDISGDSSFLVNDDGSFIAHGVLAGFNSTTTGWNNYLNLTDANLELGLYDTVGISRAVILLTPDLAGNTKILMTTDSATDVNAGTAYHNAVMEMDERGVSFYSKGPNNLLNQHGATTDTTHKAETWITTGWADDLDINNQVDYGAVGIFMTNDRTPANTTQTFYRTVIDQHDAGNSIDLSYDYFTLTTDYNLLVGPSVQTNPAEVPSYAFFPSTSLSNLLGTDTPDTTLNSASQDNFSAMVYAPDHRNLFFWTDPTGGQTGTGDWEPVSPFERDPATNRITLYDANDSVGIGAVPNSGDKLLVSGDIKVGTSATNGCLKNFSGGTITGTCSSDERLKTNIVPVENILDRFTKINLVTYDWNELAQQRGFMGGVEQLGVLAQNVEQQFPELVVTDRYGYKQVNYSSLNLLTIEAIRELDLKISQIESVANTSMNRTGLAAWFADATNGIAKIYAETFESKKVQTEQVCLQDVCIDRNQLLQIIQQSGGSYTPPVVPPPSGGDGTGDTGGDSGDTGSDTGGDSGDGGGEPQSLPPEGGSTE